MFIHWFAGRLFFVKVLNFSSKEKLIQNPARRRRRNGTCLGPRNLRDLAFSLEGILHGNNSNIKICFAAAIYTGVQFGDSSHDIIITKKYRKTNVLQTNS